MIPCSGMLDSHTFVSTPAAGQDAGCKSGLPCLAGALLLLLFIFLQPKPLVANHSASVYMLSKLERAESLLPYMSIYVSGHLEEDAATALKKGAFVPYKARMFENIDMSAREIFWQKFSLHNNAREDSVFYLFNKFYNFWSLYEIKDDKPVFVAAAGKEAKLSERNDSNYFYVCKIVLPKGEKASYLIKYLNGFYEVGAGIHVASQKHYNNGLYPDIVSKDFGRANLVQLIFSGVFIVFSIYSFLLFVQTLKKVYLYYSVFQVLIFFPLVSSVLSITFFDAYNPPLLTFLGLMQVLAYYYYFLFVESFLNVKKYSPLISRILLLGRYIVVMYTVIITISYFYFGSDVVILIFDIARGLMLLIGTISIVLSFFKLIPLSGYIAMGSFSLILFACASWLSTTDSFSSWNDYPLMETGVLIELLCFTLGLGAFSSLEEKNRILLQAELIRSL